MPGCLVGFAVFTDSLADSKLMDYIRLEQHVLFDESLVMLKMVVVMIMAHVGDDDEH